MSSEYVLIESIDLIDDDVIERAVRGAERLKRRRTVKRCCVFAAAAAAAAAVCFAVPFAAGAFGGVVTSPVLNAGTAAETSASPAGSSEADAPDVKPAELEVVAGMTSGDALTVLGRYTADELTGAWGAPAASLSGMLGEIWVSGDKSVTVCFDDDGSVKTVLVSEYEPGGDPNDHIGDLPGTDTGAALEIVYSEIDMKYPLSAGNAAVTARYGDDGQVRGSHNGIDFAADEGTLIYAAADGVVEAAETEYEAGDSQGVYVVIGHANGYETLYAHCLELFVTAGQQVKQGDVIASVGSTGFSTGPHLHFEVLYKGENIDPEKLMR